MESQSVCIKEHICPLLLKIDPDCICGYSSRTSPTGGEMAGKCRYRGKYATSSAPY